METAIISPTYHVRIPRGVREQLRLVPGQTMQVIAYGDRVELIPLRSAKDLRGFLSGPDTTFEREEEERF